MRSLGKSNYADLVDYLKNAQNKTERIVAVSQSNCISPSIDFSVHEVLATQNQNTRSKSDKTFHLLLSFRAGENINLDVLKSIEQQVCEGLGYADHQRISVVHNDTDNLHIHLAINKIHPTKLTLHEPFQFKRKLAKLCDQLEDKFGLEKDNHIPKRSTSEGKAFDMEHHAGIESLLSWIRRECLEEIRECNSWSDLHNTLSSYGLEAKLQGNGIIFRADDGTCLKASTVSRDISKPKLEARLGCYEPPESQNQKTHHKKEYKKEPLKLRVDTSGLYSKYKEDIKSSVSQRNKELSNLSEANSSSINSLNHSYRLRLSVIKLMKVPPLLRKLLYSQAKKALQTNIRIVKQNHRIKRKQLYHNYKRQTWADWLKTQALAGDKKALEALRARGIKTKPNSSRNTIKKDSMADPFQGSIDTITKKGTVIYKEGVRDDGENLHILRATESLYNILASEISKPSRLIINGSDGFKRDCVEIAAALGKPVLFDDPDLEKQKNELLKETINVRRKEERRSNTGRRNVSFGSKPTGLRDFRGSIFGSAVRDQRQPGFISKPNVGKIGRKPPPERQNRLRNLSFLGVVRDARRGEVLLQSDVHPKLEKHGTKRDTNLRRPEFISRLRTEQIDAANKYIAEREQKRLKGMDIQKHYLYNGAYKSFSYAGSRFLNDQLLVLLRRDDDIYVLPVDSSSHERLKRRKIGQKVLVTKSGKIQSIRKSR